jgi:hypothetical protein
MSNIHKSKIILATKDENIVIDGIEEINFNREILHNEDIYIPVNAVQILKYSFWIDITISSISDELRNIFRVPKIFDVFINPINDFAYSKIKDRDIIDTMARKNKTTKIDGKWILNPYLEYRSNSTKLQLISNIELY